jgi:hypothetical protein
MVFAGGGGLCGVLGLREYRFACANIGIAMIDTPANRLLELDVPMTGCRAVTLPHRPT